MAKITTRIEVPVGQVAAFKEVAPIFKGAHSFKPNAAAQQEILEAMQKRFPGLVLVDGIMTLAKDVK